MSLCLIPHPSALRPIRGPGRAHPDPFGQRGDLLGLESAGRRHLDLAIIADDLHERALIRLAGHNRRAVAVAREDMRPRIEPQAAHLLLLAVTAEAVVKQDR